jgi:RNA polymerase sigma factor (TIGR02999 family)
MRMSEFASNLPTTADPQTGDDQELVPLVYNELRKLAMARMAGEGGTSTLQPTALVHEAWLRLAGSDHPAWKNRAHFFAAAAEAMRRILIDRARRKHALKRGAGTHRINLDQIDVATVVDDESLLQVDDALDKLGQLDPQAAELIKLRFFAGLRYDEAAAAMGISERTAKRCWNFGRAWLYRELSTNSSGDPVPKEK